MTEATQQQISRIFEPLVNSCKSDDDLMITTKVFEEVIDKIDTMNKESFTDEEVNSIIRDSVLKVVLELSNYLYSENNAVIYMAAVTLDSPGSWYYDLKNAVKYYLMSAHAEHSARACFNLGCIYFHGQEDKKNNYTIDKDYSMAAAYYWYACYFGDPAEQCKYLYHLAEMYFYGWGVKQDMYEVLKLGYMGTVSDLSPNNPEKVKYLGIGGYRLPEDYCGKLQNMMQVAANIKDELYDAVPDAFSEIDLSRVPDIYAELIFNDKYGSTPSYADEDAVGIPDEYLDKIEIDTTILKDFHGQNEMEIMNSKRAKIEILLFRRFMRCSGEYMHKCPACGKGMVLRVSKKENYHAYPAFLGCTDYPNCQQVVNVIPDFDVRRPRGR
ncbi:MAG: topoisomerase DNA-binding C4 zinc finger domain-containing protein [Saccharofermentans sp.]|nr:topoisomerase DNA-binding C4 zinc finger domain-containing protein [Saccharofermentans sp.]